MAGLKVTTAATTEALTEAEIRNYIRVDIPGELGLLHLLRKAARQMAENYTGRYLLSQTVTLCIDANNQITDPLWEGTKVGPDINFYKNYITLPGGKVTAVNSVKTYDDADTATTMSTSKYYVDLVREPARVVLRTGETWPTALRVANAIEIEYVVGYATPGAIPEDIRIGMLQHIAYMYDQRGDMKDEGQARSLPPIVKSIYQPYKIMGGYGSSAYSALG